MKMTERQAEIRPIKSKLRLSILEDEEVRKINQTALNLLEDVGVKVPWEKALKIYFESEENKKVYLVIEAEYAGQDFETNLNNPV